MSRAAKHVLVWLAAVGVSAVCEGAQTGEQLFARCAVCHMQDGAGVPGSFPPLGSQVAQFAGSKAGRTYLVLVLSAGVTGRLDVEAGSYQGWMPAQSDLDAGAIAAVLNHVVRAIAQAPSSVQDFATNEVIAIRERHQNVDAAGVLRLRPKPEPPKPEQGDRASRYDRCVACHLDDGSGVPGDVPPLRSQIVALTATEQGRDYLVCAVSAGLSGDLLVGGHIYRGAMPGDAAASNAEIADVLNRVARNLAKVAAETPAFEDAEVASARERCKGSASLDVLRMRDAAIEQMQTAPGRPRQNWILNCRGCHGATAAATPALAGHVARFLRVPAGREYLVRVPGVAAAPLDDDEVASLLNWLIYSYDLGNLPVDFMPYTREEVQTLRRTPLRSDADRTRAEILVQLHSLRAGPQEAR